MKYKDKKMLFGIGIVFLFLATVGFSYAYFSNAIANKDVKDQVVETGTLSLRYVDGSEIVMNNIKPGDTITKTVYVANTGTLDAVYNLVWQELNNEITNDEMSIDGVCIKVDSTTEKEDGFCGLVSSIIVENVIEKKITIEPNIVHKYQLTITFKDTKADQNYNQGKKFSGVLGVEEYVPSQFEKDSWTTIITNVKNGNISDYNLGDTKEVDLGDLGKHNVRIANTSTPSECSTEGFSQTACGFVLEFEDIIDQKQMNNDYISTGGWSASEIYTYVTDTIYNKFPADLKDSIIDTTVVSGHGTKDSSNFTSIDKVYLLAPKEIYSLWNDSYDSAKDLTRQLDYYTSKNVTKGNYSGAIKKYGTTFITAEEWWLRSANSFMGGTFYGVSDSGKSVNYTANFKNGISPAFRIGQTFNLYKIFIKYKRVRKDIKK